jgi:hypothetical protein
LSCIHSTNHKSCGHCGGQKVHCTSFKRVGNLILMWNESNDGWQP